MSHFHLLAPICCCLLSLLLTPITIATPTPVPAPVNGDPCGPAVQDNPNYPNTCSVAPVLVQSPQPYGINCTDDPYPIPWDNCSASFQSACTKIVDKRTRNANWIWTSLGEGCSLGFYIPPFPGSAPLPNYTRCVEIFTAMRDSCSVALAMTSFASVNLGALPGKEPKIVDGQEVYERWSNNNYTYDGHAVNVGYPSYAIKGYM